MNKTLNFKIEKIYELYSSGLTLNQIAISVKASTISVKKVLLETYNIDLDKLRIEDYQNRLNKVIPFYLEGKSQLFIEKELNLTRKTIREIRVSISITIQPFVLMNL